MFINKQSLLLLDSNNLKIMLVLHCSLIFIISLLLLVLAEHTSNWLDYLLGIDLAMIASWVLRVVELRLCPTPMLLLSYWSGTWFVFRDIVGVFLLG